LKINALQHLQTEKNIDNSHDWDNLSRKFFRQYLMRQFDRNIVVRKIIVTTGGTEIIFGEPKPQRGTAIVRLRDNFRNLAIADLKKLMSHCPICQSGKTG
jgi:hypothetical protein